MVKNRLVIYRSRAARVFLAAGLSSAFLVGHLNAASEVPKNLGNGLGALVAEDIAMKTGRPVTDVAGSSTVSVADTALRDARDRVLVEIYLRKPTARGNVIKFLRSLGDAQITAEERSYQAGVLAAFVPVGKVAQIARHQGVRSVILSVAPVTDVGAVTQQGVNMHRVDQIANQTVSPVTGITGAGITIGVLSDSYDTSPGAKTRATADVATGDLPGPGNPNNSNPVIVLEDLPPSTSNIDEGRGMLQLIHDIAPKANLAFATAFTGQVGFANNIRRLAAPTTASPAGADCDIIVDDIIYFDEPMFADGIVARAADDVFAQGVPYFSSAGNRPGTQGYYSDVRMVANGTGLTAAEGNTALAGTNINLAGVDPSLYAGGFHNFNPAAGQRDVAQLVQIGTTTTTLSFQWDEPYDVSDPVVNPTVIQSGEGTVALDSDGNGSTNVDFPFNGTAGQGIEIFADADRRTGKVPLTDVTIALIDPSGRQVGYEDTNTVPDRLFIFLPVTGTYTIRISGYDSNPGAAGGESVGDFIYEVRNAEGSAGVVTDFNVLVFKPDGSFIGAVGEDNRATNRPIELPRVTNAMTGSAGQFQLVVARANVPADPAQAATKLRYVSFGAGYPQEYFSYTQTPVTFGHNSAAGANGVAAYPFYPPNIPEGFTSPGPAIIMFDKNNNRLASPEIRLKPDMAAMDGANNTFFGGDATQDTDSFPNFFGTSAAAPNAAAVAALVMEAKGGPGSVTPAQMRTMLQRSAFPHDLDPYFARGLARTPDGRVTVTAIGDPGSTANIISSNDPNLFNLSYVGTGSVTQFVLNPGGTNATAGNTTEPVDNTSGFTSKPGIVFDTRPLANVGKPFTLGTTRGITAADIAATYQNPAEPPAADGHFYTVTLNITAGALTGGEGFGFIVERDEADAFGPGGAVGGNSADLLGASVRIPQGTLAPGGMTFGGTTSGGSFTGTFQNRIGAGYSLLDGFGFINAQSAVSQPIP